MRRLAALIFLAAFGSAVAVFSQVPGVRITPAGLPVTFTNLTFVSGGALRTGTTAGNTLLLQGYNTGTGSYNPLGTLTAGNPPTILLAPFGVGANAPSGDDTGVDVARELTGVDLFSHAFHDQSAFKSTGAGGPSYASYDAIPTMSGAAAFGHLYGYQSRVTYSGSNTLGTMAGFYAQPYHGGTGTVANYFGIYFTDIAYTSTGRVTNQYALYFPALTGATTSNYAIYATGPALNYFGGAVSTGSTVTTGGNIDAPNLHTVAATNWVGIGDGTASVANAGYYGVAVGYQAGMSVAGGTTFNTFVGSAAGRLVTGGSNTLIGAYAGTAQTTGGFVTSLGASAGRYQADGATALNANNSLYLGAGARGFNDSDSNSTVIGYLAIGAGANTVVIGNSSVTDAYVGSASGAANVTASAFLPVGARITAGSGTGVTVNSVGALRRVVYKITLAKEAFVAADVTQDITIATLPAKTRLVGVYADVTQQFACTAVCTTATLSMTAGTAAGGNQILVSFDLDAAAAVFGDADAELGTSVNAAARVQDAYIASWSATQIITVRFTSGTGNIGNGSATNLSQGSVTFYLITEALP